MPPTSDPDTTRPALSQASAAPGLFRWFRPAPPISRLSDSEVHRLYPQYRWRVFEAAFIAYATFYLVRNNFAPVSKEIGAALHYDRSEEHTSELQSRRDLVCRLLLEKKKKNKKKK